MDCSAEMLQLAHLLRVSADAARDMARLRPRDAAAIGRLAEEAERMAAEIEVIVRGARDGAKGAVN